MNEIISQVRQKLRLLTIASCECGTKTPEPQHHDDNCGYRLVKEADALLAGLAALAWEDLTVAEQTTFGALWVGDRFATLGTLWTKLGHDTARQHSAESIALGQRGEGYIGDAICSFEREDAVTFVPPGVAVRQPISELAASMVDPDEDTSRPASST